MAQLGFLPHLTKLPPFGLDAHTRKLYPFDRENFPLRDPEVGVSWVLDVTTADAQGSSASSAGQALRRAEQEKQKKYAAALQARPDMTLRVVAWETFGGFGPDAHAFFERLARLCLRRSSTLTSLGESARAALTVWSRARIIQELSIAGLRRHCAVIRAAAQRASGHADEGLPADLEGLLLCRPPRPFGITDLCYVSPPGQRAFDDEEAPPLQDL